MNNVDPELHCQRGATEDVRRRRGRVQERTFLASAVGCGDRAHAVRLEGLGEAVALRREGAVVAALLPQLEPPRLGHVVRHHLEVPAHDGPKATIGARPLGALAEGGKKRIQRQAEGQRGHVRSGGHGERARERIGAGVRESARARGGPSKEEQHAAAKVEARHPFEYTRGVARVLVEEHLRIGQQVLEPLPLQHLRRSGTENV